jgi:hypothetical protein
MHSARTYYVHLHKYVAAISEQRMIAAAVKLAFGIVLLWSRVMDDVDECQDHPMEPEVVLVEVDAELESTSSASKTAESDSPQQREKRRKSVVWDYFTKKSETSAVCKKCQKTLSMLYGNTSALRRHLLTHPSISLPSLTESTPTSQRSRTVANQSIRKFCSLPENAQARITAKIGEMMVRDLQPFSIVEDPGFRALLSHIVPGYTIPDARTFSRQIVPRIHAEAVARAKKLLTVDLECLRGMSFTSDMWTSKNNDSYLALTAHYVNNSFEMKNVLLGVRNVQESHTASNIKDHLEDIIVNWGLSQELEQFIVTDNGRNIKNAVGAMNVVPLTCVAHNIQLVVRGAREEVQEVELVLKKVIKLVGYYKHSSAATARLNEVQSRSGATPKKLIQCVPTRWDSECKMAKRFLELKKAVNVELAEADQGVTALTSYEAELLSQVGRSD